MELLSAEAHANLDFATGPKTAIDTNDNRDKSENVLPIVIAATFTADLIRRPLEFWMSALRIPAEISMAPYAQVMQELLSPESSLAQNRSGINVLMIRLEDWIPAGQCVGESGAHIQGISDELVAAMNSLRERTSAGILVFFCPPSSSASEVLGSQLEETARRVMAELSLLDRVHCATHDDLLKLYPVAKHEDSQANRIGHIPYTNDYFVAIATLLARRIAAQTKPQFKVIAIDCDNTLWSGICGEDGPAGVSLTPAHLRFQQMLVQQHDAGVLLCLCSKNNAADVEAVFKNRPEMLLREEHLIAWRVNWEPKSSNLRSLADELGLSLESFIFIDDNAVECAEVQAHCASVLTLQFPQDAAEIAHFVDHVWAFDRLGVTAEAKRRTAQYKENRARSLALQQTGDLQKFLASLDLKIDIAPMQHGELVRVAELVQRTNQFNLTGIRRRAAELETLWISGEIRVLVVRVKDRFGDYGLVGSLLFRTDGRALDVDTFVLSCRVLGRGVEVRVVNELGRIARHERVPSIVLRYRPTARNQPAWSFLEKSFIQFRGDPSGNGHGASEIAFRVPAEYAESADANASKGELFANEDKLPTQASPAASASSHEWHAAAYRFSRISDVIQQMGSFGPQRPQSKGGEFVAPRTPMEAALAEIWAKVLDRSDISVCADFINLGGDSLRAVQVVARIESCLGLELSLFEFLEVPTVEAVARKLADASESDSPIIHREVTAPMPLSPAQQRLWFIDQLEGGSPAYNVPISLRLRGELDHTALSAAFDALIGRHEALRTVFITIAGEPAQQIVSDAHFVLIPVDLREYSADRQAAEVLAQTHAEFGAAFQLSTGPLIRGRLLQLSCTEHVLLITMHHIVGDGLSISILIGELGVLYKAHREGRPAPLEPLPVQYADYALWQRQAVAGKQVEQQLNYWKEHLQGAPELLELPTDRARPSVQSYRGSNVRVSLNSKLVANLRAFSRSANLTLAMTLHAAWVVVLSRLSGQDDIVVGMPVANRRRTELEGMIGYFANTLAIRVRLADDPTVAELCQRVRKILLDAHAYQDVPFELVVEALRPERSLSHNPIFQVMFVLRKSSRELVELAGLTLEPEDVSPQTAQFDLLLALEESGDEIKGNLNYATDLFDHATIERWVEGFETVLWGITQLSEERASKLPLMSDRERGAVIEVFNATRTSFDEEKLLHEIFEEQVARAPDAIAVVYEGQSLSYAALNARANQLAHHLRRMGVGPDQLVGICVERSVEMVVGLVGILKAGGAYVPLDPSYPSDRLAYMLEDAAPKVLLTQQHLVAGLPHTAGQVVALDTGWAEIARESSSNLDFRAIGLHSRHLAYLIYTSGSTGKPKGAMNEHRALINRIQWMQSQYQLTDQDRVLQKTPFSFDVSVWEFFWTLMSGARLIVAQPAGHQDPDYLRSLIETAEITTLHFVPSMLQAFLDRCPAHACPSLRHVVCSGEELPASLQRRFFERLQHAQLHNLYGPTEAAIDVTAWECESADSSVRVPIGKPIWNIQMYVLDGHRQPVPIGVTGEIYIAGVGVGRGYLNRSELTAERFVVDPFSTDPNARMYKTGDLGRWRTDGAIEYLGRNDYQVKIRGFRVELGEIEAQLMRHPKVKEVAVIARENGPGDKRLIAYMTAFGESVLTVESLRTYLKGALPEYMVPSAFVIVESLPVSPNGKLDRRALPAHELGILERRKYEAPQGDVEKALAEMWQSLLHVEGVGRHDNFFDLGGHSLLVLKLLHKVDQSFGVTLRVTDVYRSTLLQDLAARIQGDCAADEVVNLSLEADLGSDIRAISGRPRIPPRTVLLTGSTGFVGRFLLAQLLQDTDATVYCLVRARSRQHAASRLKAALTKWDLWKDELGPRVIALPGDLSSPRLGLDEADYRSLACEVDSIYHCATSMNHLETYAMARPTNVDATRDLLWMATQVKPKQVNYISTLNVFSEDGTGQLRAVTEEMSIDHERHTHSQGYAASKWVGEKLFMIAGERSIPCNIFRVGLVWADTQRGRYDELQREYRVLKSGLLSGYGIKHYRYAMAPTPVDYVARAVSFLAGQYPDGRGIFHISSSRQNIDGVFECCNRISQRRLSLKPLSEWIGEIKRLHDVGRSLPVMPLLESAFVTGEASFQDRESSVGAGLTHFDCSSTHSELERAGIIAPEFNEDLLRACVEDMVSRDEELRRSIDVSSTEMTTPQTTPVFALQPS